MPDYSKGKIYKVVCSETDRIYIGSTTQPLYKRLYGHKNMKSNVCMTKELKEPKIYLIEDFSCDRKEQLEARERHYIETLECVNMRIPTRTNTEYYREYLKNPENKKRHNEINKKSYDKLGLLRNERTKIFCECGGKYVSRNKKLHEKSNKHNKFIKNEETHENNIE